MNSKQRVLATINGVIPDRVPIGEFAVDFDTTAKIIGHETYFRAKAKSRIAFWEGRHDEVAESYIKDHIELHRKLDLDLVTFQDATWQIPVCSADPPPRKVGDGVWEDKYGRVYKFSEVTADIACIHDPVTDAHVFTVEEFEREPSPPELDPKSYQIIDTVIAAFKDGKFISAPSGGEVGAVLLGGMERGLMELIEQPEVVRAAVAYEKKRCELTDPLFLRPGTDAVMWGQDWGFKTGPFINPAMFRDFFFQANRERVKTVHDRYGKKVIKHCCGNTNRLLDLFVEIGYDVYQSIQPTADMDICRVKQTHGDKLTLWGGVAVEHIISGTADEVRQDVRRAMQCAKPGGRFILGSSHSIAVGSNYDNFMAMLDEHRKWCDY